MRFLHRKKPDCRLVLDPGPRLLGKQFEEDLLQMGTILEMNQAEAKAMGQSEDVRQAARNLQKRTGQPVIVTMGKAGTLCCTSEEETTVPAVPVKAIDTIGAVTRIQRAFSPHLRRGRR